MKMTTTARTVDEIATEPLESRLAGWLDWIKTAIYALLAGGALIGIWVNQRVELATLGVRVDEMRSQIRETNDNIKEIRADIRRLISPNK